MQTFKLLPVQINFDQDLRKHCETLSQHAKLLLSLIEIEYFSLK